MKILIVVPSFKILGGVANHYQGLNPYWKNNIKYCFQGKRQKIPAFLTFLSDLCIYLLKIIFFNPDVIIINPSFRSFQIKRDSIYALIAKLFGKKLITFFHGWDWSYSDKLLNLKSHTLSLLKNSDMVFCLFSGFKNRLKSHGFTCRIELTTTKVSNTLINVSRLNYQKHEIKTLLFLARLEENKGVFIVIESFKILKQKYPHLKLIICGDGSATEKLKSDLEAINLDIEYRGRVSGLELIKAYNEADVYVLPTTHGEGMATSILEAMAFGLPILSRPEGGVIDFFDNEKMGKLINSLSPIDYAVIIEEWINNPTLVENISKFNHLYACQNFQASKVTEKLEKLINTI